MPTATLLKAASDRTTVILPSGDMGMLVYVSPESRKAKVRVGGRHVRIPANLLSIINHQGDQ